MPGRRPWRRASAQAGRPPPRRWAGARPSAAARTPGPARGRPTRLDALEKRGFVRRLPSPADRRKVIVELTEAGRQAWLSTFNPQTNEEEKVLAVLEPDEQEQFSGMLRRMMRAIDRPGLLTSSPTSRPGRCAGRSCT